MHSGFGMEICEFQLLSIISFGKQAQFTNLNGKFMFLKIKKKNMRVVNPFKDFGLKE